MKLVSKHIERDSSGSVTLIAEESEDLWHTYNLLSPNDTLKATTIRRVVSESTTGSTDKTSHKVTLTISVESVFFDVQGLALRVNGRNIVENKFVKMGQYHTLDLELHRPFTITKPEWDLIHWQRIQDCCDVAKRADIAAVVLQEGLAQVCLVTENMTIVKQRIEQNVPKKRRGTTSDYDKGISKFLAQIYQSLLTHVDFTIVKVLLIASPGFIKDSLYKYILQEAIRENNKTIMENKSKIVLVHSSSGHKHALAEILQDPVVQSKLSDTKYAMEASALDQFYKCLASDPAKAFYGYEYVIKAVEFGAVETLMVTDDLFRSSDIVQRKKYIKLFETVKSMGGKCLVFSSLHTSGEQLKQLTGIAAILHFPMPDLEDQVQEEEERKRRGKLVGEEDHLVLEDKSVNLGY